MSTIKRIFVILTSLLITGALGCSEDSRGGLNGSTSDTDSTGSNGTNGDQDIGPLDTDPPDELIETFVCNTPTDAGGFTFDKIAVWQDDATAAYSMIFDDYGSYAVRGIAQYAVPEMNKHGIKGCLGAIADQCDDNDLAMARIYQEQGHEIANHSYTHPQITTENIADEVTAAKTFFDEHLTDPVSFFVYPFDYFTPQTVAAVLAAGHIGTRGGSRDDNDGFENPPLNPSTPTNDGEIEFDVWPRTYSKYSLYRSPDFLEVHIWNAIEEGAWAVREFHSVVQDGDLEDNGFGPIELTDFTAHLDFLVDAWKKNVVWTSTPSRIIRYRRARTACGADVSEDTISYDTSNADCTAYATPISVIVKTGTDVSGVQATQGGTPVTVRKIAANTFSITADPTKGNVTLEGCADACPTVEAGDISPKPDPADSVCDIIQVTGTGDDGAMDDLERDVESFQILPNPGQADGRDGNWSSYPGEALLEHVQDGDTKAVYFAGTNLGTYAGVSLAFLGGNGGGTCYDANAYSGIQFDIKGAVTDPTNWSLDQMTISLVSAYTQTNALGGNVECQVGHYHHMMEIPNATSYQTVQVPFSSFVASTYVGTDCPAGFTHPSPSLTQVVSGLQAIDWGFTDGATQFEIYLDNIRLY